VYDDAQTFFDSIHPDDRERVFDGQRDPAREFEHEYRIIRGDGAVRWIRDRGYAVRDDAGNIMCVVGVAQDVTERRRLEEALRQAQKMEAIGQLAGGIAHDFNNMLQALLLELQLLGAVPELPERAGELARSARGTAERAASLTRQLLLFSRREVLKPRALDLDAALVELANMLRRVLGEDIALQLALGARGLHLYVDPGMLDQVLLNLAVNARDAMPRGGTLAIATARTDAAARPGAFGCITVRDTGVGIARDVLPRIFEPFFTTKEAGHGTGLGLATAFGIVEQHGGWIEVESEPNHGTTFRTYLPVHTIQGLDEQTPLPTGRRAGRRDTVLVVEDNEHVRRAVCAVLDDAGYRVVDADRGTAALSAWHREGGAIDLVLTDLVMPGGMDGVELAARLEELRPGVKVVFATGNSRDLAVGPNQRLLRKPLSAERLLDAVRACLES
jgi:two-component system, cell cycle sensor histidine kinase and response regulator CckA